MDLNRSGIQWRLDPRLSEDQQTGERLYARNDIDRGHLVRRASTVWGGSRQEAAQANEDTFHYTNAAPQAAKFNQGLDLWLGLESYLLDHAADHHRRTVVFTGPIFGGTDPLYRGVEIPLLFFKVAAFLHNGKLSSTGYVVDQTPVLGELPDVRLPRAVGGPPRWALSESSRSRSVLSLLSQTWISGRWRKSTGCPSRRPCRPRMQHPRGDGYSLPVTWPSTSARTANKRGKPA